MRPRACKVNIKEEYEPGVNEPLDMKHQRPDGSIISPFSGYLLLILLLDLTMGMTFVDLFSHSQNSLYPRESSLTSPSPLYSVSK